MLWPPRFTGFLDKLIWLLCNKAGFTRQSWVPDVVALHDFTSWCLQRSSILTTIYRTLLGTGCTYSLTESSSDPAWDPSPLLQEGYRCSGPLSDLSQGERKHVAEPPFQSGFWYVLLSIRLFCKGGLLYKMRHDFIQLIASVF